MSLFTLGSTINKLRKGLDAKTSSDIIGSVSPEPNVRGLDHNMWSANPYANFDYRHTWWQKLWEGLGFRSQFDAYRESMANNAREYEAQLLDKAHNEEYDSAVAQAARERAAGINPDLVGNVDPGSSSAMEPDPNAPISPGYDDPSVVVEGFANTVMSALTGGLALAKSGMDLMMLKNDVEAGSINNSKSIFDFAMLSAAQYIPSEMPVDDPEWKERAVQLALEANGNFLNKRQMTAFTRQLRALYNSAPTQAEQYKSWYDMMTNKQQAYAKKGSSFWDDDEEILMDILQPVIDALDEVFEKRPRVESAQLDAQGAEAAYNEAYFSTADGALAGEVQNITNERNKASAHIDSILNEAMDAIISNLKDRSESNKRGHSTAAAVLVIFQLLRMMNFHPSFSSSSATGSTPYGSSFHSSSSFGF